MSFVLFEKKMSKKYPIRHSWFQLLTFMSLLNIVVAKLFSSRKKSACTKVPAMRCRIEKRTVVKTKPESKCSRIPRQLCRKEDCDDVLEDLNVQDFDQAASESRDELLNGDADCYYRNQVVSFVWLQSIYTHSFYVDTGSPIWKCWNIMKDKKKYLLNPHYFSKN